MKGVYKIVYCVAGGNTIQTEESRLKLSNSIKMSYTPELIEKRRLAGKARKKISLKY